jgi:hypothetical protein
MRCPLEGLVVEHGIGQQLLEPSVLVLQTLEPLGIRHRHAAELRPPFVDRRLRDVVPSAQLGASLRPRTSAGSR